MRRQSLHHRLQFVTAPTARKFVMVLGEKHVSVAGSQVIFLENVLKLILESWSSPAARLATYCNGNEVRDKAKLNVRFMLPTVINYLHIFMRLVDAITSAVLCATSGT
jgi:hypothetical protein